MDLIGNVLSLAGVLPPIFSAEMFDQKDELEGREFERMLVTAEFGVGEAICNQGFAPACVWIVDAGTGILSMRMKNDELLFAQEVRAGYVVGLTESLARIPFVATLRTVSPCVGRQLERGNLVELLRRRPGLRQRMLETLARMNIEALSGLSTMDPCDPYHIPRTNAGIEWLCKSKSLMNRRN